MIFFLFSLISNPLLTLHETNLWPSPTSPATFHLLQLSCIVCLISLMLLPNCDVIRLTRISAWVLSKTSALTSNKCQGVYFLGRLWFLNCNDLRSGVRLYYQNKVKQPPPKKVLVYREGHRSFTVKKQKTKTLSLSLTLSHLHASNTPLLQGFFVVVFYSL